MHLTMEQREADRAVQSFTATVLAGSDTVDIPRDEDTQLILYCLAGRRSELACHAARAAGYRNVRNYAGSWAEWAEIECSK
jgi:rhodanese-related sulfurtransferase